MLFFFVIGLMACQYECVNSSTTTVHVDEMCNVKFTNVDRRSVYVNQCVEAYSYELEICHEWKIK